MEQVYAKPNGAIHEETAASFTSRKYAETSRPESPSIDKLIEGLARKLRASSSRCWKRDTQKPFFKSKYMRTQQRSSPRPLAPALSLTYPSCSCRARIWTLIQARGENDSCALFRPVGINSRLMLPASGRRLEVRCAQTVGKRSPTYARRYAFAKAILGVAADEAGRRRKRSGEKQRQQRSCGPKWLRLSSKKRANQPTRKSRPSPEGLAKINAADTAKDARRPAEAVGRSAKG